MPRSPRKPAPGRVDRSRGTRRRQPAPRPGNVSRHRHEPLRLPPLGDSEASIGVHVEAVSAALTAALIPPTVARELAHLAHIALGAARRRAEAREVERLEAVLAGAEALARGAEQQIVAGAEQQIVAGAERSG